MTRPLAELTDLGAMLSRPCMTDAQITGRNGRESMPPRISVNSAR
jgi:hypothetical protein